MAKRIIYLPNLEMQNALYREELVDFDWVPGMAISQAKKSVRNLHTVAKEQLGISRILEISTRSELELGLSLSAFNLSILHENRMTSVESLYQSSKVFQNGGPFTDLISASSMHAKQDPRLKDSGSLTGFYFKGQAWPLTTSPNFYDYLYISALLSNKMHLAIADFQAFSDIAFSQSSIKYKKGKSYNCQARSAAICLTLMNNLEDSAILEALGNFTVDSAPQTEQLGLF
jgi:hypothetical protein